MIAEAVVSFLLVAGAVFALIGSLGLARLPDVFMRLHGPTKATTLGLGGILTGSATYFSTTGSGLSLHEVLVTFFLFLTAPVSGHLMAKAALALRLEHKSAGAPSEELLGPETELGDPEDATEDESPASHAPQGE